MHTHMHTHMHTRAYTRSHTHARMHMESLIHHFKLYSVGYSQRARPLPLLPPSQPGLSYL
jgi:hypothetical protein